MHVNEEEEIPEKMNPGVFWVRIIVSMWITGYTNALSRHLIKLRAYESQ